MASEEGLKILLKAEVQDFLKDMKSAKDAVTTAASSTSKAVKSFLGFSSAAEGASKSTEELTNALKSESQVVEQSAKRWNQMGKFIFEQTYARKAMIKQVQQGIGGWKLEGRAIEQATRSMPPFNKATGLANTTLNSLNQIVQDFPYGIRGWGNNLTQSASLLGALISKTGSFSSALKALGTSFLGSGGVLLGVSLAVNGYQQLIEKYGSLTNGILALTGAYDKQAQIQDEVNKGINENLGGVQGEITRVQSLLKIINDESEARKTRLNALKEIQKEYPGYFENIKLDENLTVNLVTAHDKLIQVLKRHAQAKAILGQIEKNYTEILNIQNKNVIASATAWQTFSSLVINGSNVAATAAELAAQGAKNQKEQIDQLNKSTENLTKQYDELIKQDAINNTFGDPTKVEKAGKNIRTVADVLKVLNASLAATNAQYKLFGGTTDNLAQEKLRALNKAFDDLVKIGLKPTSPELKKVADQINLISASVIGTKGVVGKQLFSFDNKNIKIAEGQILSLRSQIEHLIDQGFDPASDAVVNLQSKLLLFQGIVGTRPLINVDDFVSVSGKLNAIIPSLQNAGKAWAAFVNKMNAKGQDLANQSKILQGGFVERIAGVALITKKEFDSLDAETQKQVDQYSINLSGAMASAFSGLGDTIGNAFSYGGGIQTALQGVLSLFAGFVKQLGESLIASGTAMLAAKLLIKNPATAIAAGIAAVAISSALQNQITNAFPSFATGGVVSGPTLAMVGDNPSGIEYMIPKEVLDQLGGGSPSFVIENRIERSEFVTLVRGGERENRRFS